MYTKGKLTVKEVIKGNVGATVLDIEFIPERFEQPLQKKIFEAIFGTNPNEARIFSVYKNQGTEQVWRVSVVNGFRLDVVSKIVSLNAYNPHTKQFYNSTGVSIPDFKAGIALFEAKYTYFQEKRANNFSIVLENPTKNQTFAFLAKEMMGDFIYTPKKVGKTVKKVKKERR